MEYSVFILILCNYFKLVVKRKSFYIAPVFMRVLSRVLSYLPGSQN